MGLKSLIPLSLLDNFNYYKSNYKPYNSLYRSLENYSKSSIRADVNSLLKSGDLEKITKNGTVCFSLTLKGFRVVSTRFLRQYHGLKNRWDGKWRIIIFDIPESKKEERAKLRQILKGSRFGKLANSIYVSPSNNLESTLKLVKENLKANLFAFETKQTPGFIEDAQIAKIAFRLADLKKRYLDWIKKTKEKERIDTLISYYDTILESDPALPQELLPDNWPYLHSWTIFIGLLKK